MHGYRACLETERTALLEIKSFFVSISDIGYDDKILPSWVGEDDGMPSDCCDDWEGVMCNATTRRVMQLSLNETTKFNYPFNSIFVYEGPPTLLLNMSLFHPFEELQRLDLFRNRFTGIYKKRAYDSFGSLKQLKMLNLEENFFNDSILPYLNTLTSLTTLNLGYNKIEGSRTKQGLANLRYLQVLDLSANHNITSGSLTRLGLTNLTNLKKLDLCDCGITAIQIQGLANLTNLQVLDLSYNQNLTMLAHGGFVDLPNLKELTLRYCGITTTQGLANLTNLQVLDLSYNQNLTTLGLADLPNLKALDLRYCGITTIQGLANLTNLQVLDLSNNRNLTTLGFADLPNLKALDLRYCGLTTIQGLCELKNLFELNLKGNNVEGHLPNCLKYLSHLKVFDISQNQLSGSLSSTITSLTSLEYLDLSYNNFEGPCPLSLLAHHSKLEVLVLSSTILVKTENFLPTFQLKELGLANCSLNVVPTFLLHQYDLKYLDLSHNNLVGDFLSWVLQNNTKLEVLFLTNNSFTGNLQLPNTKHDFLHHLDASSNNFIGTLPQDMGTVLQKLLFLNISNNHFEGNIPSSVGEMKELIILHLSKNNFSGELSASFLTGCISLWFLDLSDNNFYGQIFSKYMNLTQLGFLYLENNKFSGKIEEGLLNSPYLQQLDISNNILSGHIPRWIGNFSSFEFLLMANNCLEGNIPVQLLNHRTLELLSVSENYLSGSMTSSFNLSSLKHLYAKKNALSGPIPDMLFRSSELMTLDLRDNGFFGRIPCQINDRSNLRVLLLRGNNLEGQIPNQMCQLRRLGMMDLSHNRFNGSIPSCFTNMLQWTIGNVDLFGDELLTVPGLYFGTIGTYYNSTLDLSVSKGDEYTSPQLVKVEFMTKNRYELYNGSNLNYMVGLDLSCNELTGNVPSEIGDLQKIRGLNLSHNCLSGSMPRSFSNLKMIESLDLSNNRLSGQIPAQLIELNFLSNFNVSYNNLSGLIPDKGQYSTFDENSYRGNLYLCGPTINKSCNSAEEIPAIKSKGREDKDDSAIDMVSLYWSFGASYVTILSPTFMLSTVARTTGVRIALLSLTRPAFTKNGSETPVVLPARCPPFSVYPSSLFFRIVAALHGTLTATLWANVGSRVFRNGSGKSATTVILWDRVPAFSGDGYQLSICLWSCSSGENHSFGGVGVPEGVGDGEGSSAGPSGPAKKMNLGHRVEADSYPIDFIACATTPTDLFKLRNLYNIPNEVLLVIPGKGDVPSRPPKGYVTMHLESFRLGARLPLQRYFAKILGDMHLAPGQLHPNGWRVLSAMFVLWERCGLEEHSLVEAKHLYQLRSSPREAGWYYFMFSSAKRKPITGFPSSCKNWKNKFFFAGGNWCPAVRPLESWGLIEGLEDRPLLQVETALVNASTCQDLLSPTNLVDSGLVDIAAGMDNKILSAMSRKRGRAPSSSSNPPPPPKKTSVGPSKALVPTLPPPPPRKSGGERASDKSPEVSIQSGDRSSPLPSRDQGDYLSPYKKDYRKSVGPKMVKDIESMDLSELAGYVQRVSFRLATLVSCYKNGCTRLERRLQADNQELKKKAYSADRSKEKLAELNKHVTDLEEKVVVAESNTSKLEGELSDLKSDLQATQSERDTLRTALEGEIKSLSEQLAEEKGKSADVDDRLDAEYDSERYMAEVGQADKERGEQDQVEAPLDGVQEGEAGGRTFEVGQGSVPPPPGIADLPPPEMADPSAAGAKQTLTCLSGIFVELAAGLSLTEQKQALTCLSRIFVELAVGLSLTEQKQTLTCLSRIFVELAAGLLLTEQKQTLTCLSRIFVELAAGLSLTEQKQELTCLSRIFVELAAGLSLTEQKQALTCLSRIFVELAAGLSLTEQK
ncbi:Receptor-like protein 1 [Citrus sinensis]|uniref:Receptor-like protein 1 n=1 Tax=Citrus sinensis TaxID=2711 RepID=A0ACB8JCP1_CITSI|nr:Receptor-like protein 1 [Citrus sinensis]